MKARYVRETIREGVADKYLANKHVLPYEFEGFDKRFRNLNIDGEVVVSDGDWKLIKNPTSIKNLGKYVRGIILDNGDFYVENTSEVIHNDILKILFKEGIIPELPRKNWTGKLPQETGFLTVQRYKDTPYVAIGESNKLIYDEMDYEERKKHYSEFMERAKKKLPGIRFIDKLVGTKYLKKGGKSNLMEHHTS